MMNKLFEQINLCVDNLDERQQLRSFIVNTINGHKTGKLMVLYGGGNNGKSTLLNQLTNLVKTVHLPSTILTNDRNTNDGQILSEPILSPMLSKLEGKQLIIFQEIDMPIKNNNLFFFLNKKNITIRDLYQSEREISNNGNYIIAINNLNVLTDVDPELYELVTFNKIFTQSDSNKLPCDDNKLPCNGNKPLCNGNKPPCNSNKPPCDENQPQYNTCSWFQYFMNKLWNMC